MRLTASVVMVALMSSWVAAQPAPQQPQQPQQPYPQQYPPQQYPPQQQPPYGQRYPYPAPPQGYYPPYPQQVQLTVDEQWLLERGYISDGEHIGGGLAAVFLGFGAGQAIQGRWSDRGWIFTLGEAGSIVLAFYSLAQGIDECNDNDSVNCGNRAAVVFAGSILTFAILRVWETIDAFAVPPAHNDRVRALRMRLGLPVPMYSRVTPLLAPSHSGEGGIAGVSIRF